MELYYTIGVMAILLIFFLMILLSIYLIRDQAKLCYRQELLEERTKIELESFREQVKTIKRGKEEEEKNAAAESRRADTLQNSK